MANQYRRARVGKDKLRGRKTSGRGTRSAWTLIGHEFVELKNTSAAIQAYRKAVDINPSDFRAWYGLGQTYEMLMRPHFALYYYKQAAKIRSVTRPGHLKATIGG